MAEHSDKQHSDKTSTPGRPSQAEGERQGDKRASSGHSEKPARPSQAEGERETTAHQPSEKRGTQ